MKRPPAFPFNNYVLIGYSDAGMKHECIRAYPVDEKTYYACMANLLQQCNYWQCAVKTRLTKKELDDYLGPYEHFQQQRFGNVLSVDRAFKTHGYEYENNYARVNHAELRAEEYFNAQLNDYWGI